MSADYVRPDVSAFLAGVNSAGGPEPREIGAVDLRKAMAGLATITDTPLRRLPVDRAITISIEGGSDVPARIFDSWATRGDSPVVIFFHGGGFVTGDLETYASVCAEMAWSLDLPVLAVDYRLAPEHPWPAAPCDCEGVARAVAGCHQQLGFKPTGLVLAGESAGAWLSIVTALALRERPAETSVLACWLCYPWIEPENTSHPSYETFGSGHLVTANALAWFRECFDADAEHWQSHLLSADLNCFPPSVIMTAGLDPLRDQGREFAGRLIASGVRTVFLEAQGNVHAFLGLRQAIPSSSGDFSMALGQLRLLLSQVAGTE